PGQGRGRAQVWHALPPAARPAERSRSARRATACGGAGGRRKRRDAGRASRACGSAPVAGVAAHRRRRSLLSILAIGAAGAGDRRNGCRNPDLRVAHRSLPGPGIPELAQELRALICLAVLAAACISAPAVAGPLAPRAPAWSELSAADQRTLAPLAPDWDQLDAQRRQKWLGIAKRYPNLGPAQQQRVQQQTRACPSHWPSSCAELRSTALECSDSGAWFRASAVQPDNGQFR